MLDDNLPPSPEQQTQIAGGQFAALSAAVHALIASHPDPKAFASCFEQYDQVMQQILLTRPALQLDDGLRQADSEIRASLLAAIPPR